MRCNLTLDYNKTCVVSSWIQSDMNSLRQGTYFLLNWIFLLLNIKWKCWQLNHVQLFATLWTVAASSSVQGIFQARILEYSIIPFSRGSSWPRDWTQVSCITSRFFALWATKEGMFNTDESLKCSFRTHWLMGGSFQNMGKCWLTYMMQNTK